MIFLEKKELILCFRHLSWWKNICFMFRWSRVSFILSSSFFQAVNTDFFCLLLILFFNLFIFFFPLLFLKSHYLHFVFISRISTPGSQASPTPPPVLCLQQQQLLPQPLTQSPPLSAGWRQLGTAVGSPVTRETQSLRRTMTHLPATTQIATLSLLG